jgi:hypothetical protein
MISKTCTWYFLKERSNFESRSVRNLYRTVLDNEESLVHDVDAFLEYVDIANENRRVELFKKWSERVYTPLQVVNPSLLQLFI